MADQCGHFLFDTFRVNLRKGVFLYPFPIDSVWDKPIHFGSTWPEVWPRCRSSPTPFRFTNS